MKIRPVGTEFFPCGRTDRQTMLLVAFRSFVNALKISHGCFLFEDIHLAHHACTHRRLLTVKRHTVCRWLTCQCHRAGHRTHYNVWNWSFWQFAAQIVNLGAGSA